MGDFETRFSQILSHFVKKNKWVKGKAGIANIFDLRYNNVKCYKKMRKYETEYCTAVFQFQWKQHL